jgi:lysophospholipase L1-like esterase
MFPMLVAAVPLVVALGDSITFGYGLSSPSSQNYAARYAQRIHGNLVNLAVPGSQCDDVANNEIPKMPRSASIVILNCGSNDIGGFGFTPEGKPDGTKRTAPANDAELAEAEHALVRALVLIRAKAPHATIYLVNLRHWQRMSGPESPQFAKDVNAWNATLARTGLQVIDISSDPRMNLAAFILPDLLHPNAEGNAAIASDFH